MKGFINKIIVRKNELALIVSITGLMILNLILYIVAPDYNSKLFNVSFYVCCVSVFVYFMSVVMKKLNGYYENEQELLYAKSEIKRLKKEISDLKSEKVNNMFNNID